MSMPSGPSDTGDPEPAPLSWRSPDAPPLEPPVLETPLNDVQVSEPPCPEYGVEGARAPTAPEPERGAVVHRWRSLRGQRAALSVLLALVAAGLVVLGVAFASRYAIAHAIDHRGLTTTRLVRLNDADDFVGIAYVAVYALTLVAGLVFIVWMWRAARNNEALARTHPRLGPAWAIAGWFLPFVNLVLPVMLAQDLWRGADSSVARGQRGWRRSRGSYLIGAWWTCFVVSWIQWFGIATRGERRHALRFVDHVQQRDPIAIVGAGAGAAAAVLAILVVRALTTRQEECLFAQREVWDAAHRSA